MNLVPNDISAYYDNVNKSVLYQGDIICNAELGFYDSSDAPEYWLIITKSCDLVFRTEKKEVKNNICTLLGIYSLKKHLQLIKKKYFTPPKNDYLARIIIAGVFRFSKSTKSIIKPNMLTELVDDKITKLMFLPPDGKILTEPMLIDFDLLYPSHVDDVEIILAAKKLQLSSPFRERISQRFATHYSSIGINDSDVKNRNYRDDLKKYYESL